MARFTHFVLIIFFAFSSLAAGTAFGQAKQYASVEELEAAFRANERQFDQKSADIGKIKDQQVDKKAEIKALEPSYLKAATEAANAYNAWIAMRDNPPADVDTFITAMDAKKLEQVYYEKLINFARVDQKIRGLIDQHQALIRSEDGAWKALNKLWHKRLELLGQTEFFNPPHLKEVKVIRENPLTHGEDILYSKTWKGGEEFELLKLNIENQLGRIASVEKMIKTAEDDVAYRRGLFLQAHENWIRTNLEYEQAIYTEAETRVFLELVDVAIATKGGTSVPSVIFALMWRGKGFFEYMAGEGGPSFEMPTLSDDYANLIKKLGSEVDAGRKSAAAYGRPQNIVDMTVYGDSFLWGLGGELFGESKKTVVSFAATTLRDARLQKALAGNHGWWALVEASRQKAFDVYTSHGGGALENFSSLERHLSTRGQTLGEYWLNTVKNKKFQWNTFKDVALGMGLTVGKEIINYGVKQARFTTFKRLAILEIEWFIRRNEYNAAFWFREQQKEILRNLMEELGTLYAQKFGECCVSEPVFDPNLQIATTQAADITMVTLVLTFSQPMKPDITVSLDGQSKTGKPRYNEFVRSNENNTAVYEMPVADLLDDPENFEGGSFTLTITGQSYDNQALDGNPATQAVFIISSGDWKGYESRGGGGDQTSTLNFVKPEVSVAISAIQPKPEEVPVEITFKSVNSFPEDAAVAIYPAKKQTWHHLYKEYPHEVLNGRLTGTATVTASLEPGDYEVRLDDGFGGEAAVVKLTVSYPGFTIKAKLRGEDVNSELVVNSNQ
jgi:hypothetical protein